MRNLENEDDFTKVQFSSYDNCAQDPITQEDFYNFDMSFKQCVNHCDIYPEIENFMKLHSTLDREKEQKMNGKISMSLDCTGDQCRLDKLSNYLQNFNDKTANGQSSLNGNISVFNGNNGNAIVQMRVSRENGTDASDSELLAGTQTRKCTDSSQFQVSRPQKKLIFQTTKDSGEKYKATMTDNVNKIPLQLQLPLHNRMKCRRYDKLFSSRYGNGTNTFILAMNHKHSYEKRRKMLQNCISAKKCRQKKKDYLANLEKNVSLAKKELEKLKSSRLTNDSSIIAIKNDHHHQSKSFDNFLTLLKQSMPRKFHFLERYIFIPSCYISQNEKIEEFITNINKIQLLLREFYTFDSCKQEGNGGSMVYEEKKISFFQQLYIYLASLKKISLHFSEFLFEVKKLEESDSYHTYSGY